MSANKRFGSGDKIQLAQILCGGSGATTLDDTATEYACLVGVDHSINTTESAHKILIGKDGHIKNFAVKISGAPGAGKSYTFTVRVNDADSTITCAVSGASDTEAEDATHEVTVTKGNRINLKIVPAGTPTVVYGWWAIQYVPW